MVGRTAYIPVIRVRISEPQQNGVYGVIGSITDCGSVGFGSYPNNHPNARLVKLVTHKIFTLGFSSSNLLPSTKLSYRIMVVHLTLTQIVSVRIRIRHLICSL